MLQMFIESIQWFGQNMMAFVIPFVLVLSLLVFIHEWGHYIVAKWCGVKVEAFSIGFGRELFGFTDKSGTRWKFCMIPLGGYVKMFGDVDPASAQHSETVEVQDGEEGEKRPMTDEERKQAFFSKAVWQRALIVFAGPAINFLFAFAVFTFVYAYDGKMITPPVAAAIVKGSAADSYGIQPHDRLAFVNGRAMERFQDIQRQVSIKLDQGMPVTVQRGDEQISFANMKPDRIEMEDKHGFKHERGMLGIQAPGSSFDLNDMTNIAGVDVNGMSFEDRKEIFVQNMDTTFEFSLGLTGDEEVKTYIIHPMSKDNEAFLNGESEYPVLHTISADDIKTFTIPEAFVESLKETEEILSGTLDALGQMFTGVRSASELGGLVRIGAVAGDAADKGIIPLLLFAALLSINLGFLNLFPIPVLDGGHLVFYFIEAAKGSPVPEKIQDYAFGAGMLVIVGLMLFANLNDLYQLLLS